MPYPHMPAGTFTPSTGGFQSFVVDYTATGSEGTDFNVPIGKVMADTSYGVVMQSAGGTQGDGTESGGVQLLDIPKAGRAIGQFRVLIGSPLTAGDILEFVIMGTVS
jgi:hypothetical protein